LRSLFRPGYGSRRLSKDNRPHIPDKSGNVHPNKTLPTRAILAAIAALALVICGCANAPKMYRVGILIGADTMEAIAEGFQARMTELGYVEGKNIAYDIRRSNADPAAEKRIASNFVTSKVDLVFAFPGQPASVVKTAVRGTKIPIVFANAIIEGADLVDSVRNPGENITGVRNPGPGLALKSFESLLELIPGATRVMVIYNPTYPTNRFVIEALRSVASSHRVTLQEVRITNVADTQAALQGLEKSGARMSAVLLFPDLITRSSEASGAIIRFADEHRVPVAGGPPTLVQNGAVLSATIDRREQGSLAASLADKILTGTPASSIPVVTTQPHLFINYKKARELGLTVPEGLLKQATEIIR